MPNTTHHIFADRFACAGGINSSMVASPWIEESSPTHIGLPTSICVQNQVQAKSSRTNGVQHFVDRQVSKRCMQETAEGLDASTACFRTCSRSLPLYATLLVFTVGDSDPSTLLIVQGQLGSDPGTACLALLVFLLCLVRLCVELDLTYQIVPWRRS